MNAEEYNRKNDELKMLITSWCNSVGCDGCIYARYDEDGKELNKCRVTELNNELIGVTEFTNE